MAKALARFEADTRHRDFRAFHFEQAIAFKKHLAEQKGQRSGEKSAARIRTIFRDAFTCAELPYFNPHSFRNTLVRLGQSVCKTPEKFKAWSQNLGHDKVLATFLSYGQVESPRQGEIIRGLATPQVAMQSDVSELAKALVREMRGSGAQLSQTRGGPSAGILK